MSDVMRCPFCQRGDPCPYAESNIPTGLHVTARELDEAKKRTEELNRPVGPLGFLFGVVTRTG